MKTIFIVNPSARNEHSSSSWDKFSKQLNISHSTFVTTHPRDVRDIIVKLTNQHPDELFYLIGVGGDGTMNSVISAAIGFENVLVGYIPFGSGNDFARGYNWPNNKKRAYTLIQEENSIKNLLLLDAGEFTFKKGPHGHFVNNIGIGFDARIAQKANASLLKKRLNKWSLGKLIYPIVLCKETLRFKTFSLTLKIDGETHHFTNVWFTTISNHPYFGGGMKISPLASPMDGELDVIIVSGLAKWKLLLLFLSVFFGKHTKFKEVRTYKGKTVVIQSTHGVPVHADGDAIGDVSESNELTVGVLPSSWKMLNKK